MDQGTRYEYYENRNVKNGEESTPCICLTVEIGAPRNYEKLTPYTCGNTLFVAIGTSGERLAVTEVASEELGEGVLALGAKRDPRRHVWLGEYQFSRYKNILHI